MELFTSQEEIRRIIIIDMVKKRNSIVPGRFLDNFMDFVSKNASCIKLKDEVLDFLVTFNFPIITTVCFEIIEQ